MLNLVQRFLGLLSRSILPKHKIAWRYTLHLHIASLFAAFTLLLGSGLIWFTSQQSEKLALTASESLFSSVSQAAVGDLSGAFSSAQGVVSLISSQINDQSSNWEKTLSFLRYGLDGASSVSALFVGYPDGDYVLLRRIPAGSPLLVSLDLPEGTRYQAQVMLHKPDGSQTLMLYFFDEKMRRFGERRDAVYADYDVRHSLWYQRAIKNDGPIMTPLYVHQDTKQVGLSVARSIPNGKVVVGADLMLGDISSNLAQRPLTENAQLLLFDNEGRLLADRMGRVVSSFSNRGVQRIVTLDDIDVPAVKQLARLINLHEVLPSRIEVAGQVWHMHVVTMQGPGGELLYLALLSPEDELLAGVSRIKRHTALITGLFLALAMPLLWWVARRATLPLKDLLFEAGEIQRFHFDGPSVPSSYIHEFDNLARSMNVLKATLNKFMNFAHTLAGEHNFDRLIERILNETVETGHAAGGVVFLVDAQNNWLNPARMCWQGKENDAEIVLPSIAPELISQHPATRSAEQGSYVEILSGEEISRWYGALLAGEEEIQSLVVPLRNREHKTIGMLQLFLPSTEGKMQPDVVVLIEALAESAAMAIEAQRLIEQQRGLLESFIQLIARAIDAKSPYTGWHCQRVPELAKMMAQRMCESQNGIFTDFKMSEDDWESLHIASWLHDCGKITTPDHVADKATKLEMVTNRIHEIRNRFEIAKCNEEINSLREILAGGDKIQLQRDLKKVLREIDDDFAFIASCNPGSEAMGQEKIARIEKISRRTWRRTLSDRIGISREELRRKNRQPEPALPVDEPLLADRREHLIFRGLHELPNPDLNIKTPMPKYLYNYGEIYNLCIGYGTLNTEERYKINQHIVQTISLLSKLPFPYHLRNVPEIAGGHHERMDGKGYPRNLKGNEMSLLARMMAIVDIFEALTAGDRPYKVGKKLSEVLRIMQSMKIEGHIDPDIFDLFLSTGVYRDYAERYLTVDQIDI